jgi:adenosylmethionine-8-amino-7-oxononanoate aminotransferase
MKPVTVDELIERSRSEELVDAIAGLIDTNGFLEGHQLAELVTLDDRTCQMVIQALVAIFASGRAPEEASRMLSEFESYSMNHLEFGKTGSKAKAETVVEYLWQMASNIRNSSKC